MEYQALYRKYRPATFAQLIGQDHITTILKNQIMADHVSHAYLFSGTRGTGKTSTAKIFAKAVNCLAPKDGEPCGECAACTAGIDGNVDIVELDAASNNKVDDVRALIEKSVFAPLKLKKKVYIIDEAHMLTAQAFNALLKTLEEPPAHVLFILATTEPHKILPTIASRCQRFDFRRIRISDIVKCVDSVVKQAGGSIDDAGLLTIARKANGGMRDALSLADQCLSFCGNNVTGVDVHRILGSMDDEYMFCLTDALIASNASSALRMFDEICGGRDVSSILQGLILHIRALLITLICGGDCADILDCTEYEMERYKEQAVKTSPERLTRSVNLLMHIQPDLKFYTQPRIPVEYALVCICRPENENTSESYSDRLSALEKKLENGAFVSSMQSIPTQSERAVEINAAPFEGDKASAASKKKHLSSDKDAAELFSKLLTGLSAIPELVPAQAVLANAVATKFENNALTIYFTAELHVQLSEKSKPSIKKVLAAVSGDSELNIVFKRLSKSDYDTEKIHAELSAMFGDISIKD